MVNTVVSKTATLGSNPSGPANYGVVSVIGSTTDCDSVSAGSSPVQHPIKECPFCTTPCGNEWCNYN